jgi:hypothetical protein
VWVSGASGKEKYVIRGLTLTEAAVGLLLLAALIWAAVQVGGLQFVE